MSTGKSRRRCNEVKTPVKSRSLLHAWIAVTLAADSDTGLSMQADAVICTLRTDISQEHDVFYTLHAISMESRAHPAYCCATARCFFFPSVTALSHHELVPHLEDLFEVGCHSLGLVAEAAVGANAHAVLPGHGQDGRAVVLQDRLRLKKR